MSGAFYGLVLACSIGLVAAGVLVMAATAHRRWIGANVTLTQWGLAFILLSAWVAIGVVSAGVALRGLS